MPLPIKVVMKFANFLSPQKQTSPREEGAAAVHCSARLCRFQLTPPLAARANSHQRGHENEKAQYFCLFAEHRSRGVGGGGGGGGGVLHDTSERSTLISLASRPARRLKWSFGLLEKNMAQCTPFLISTWSWCRSMIDFTRLPVDATSKSHNRR